MNAVTSVTARCIALIPTRSGGLGAHDIHVTRSAQSGYDLMLVARFPFGSAASALAHRRTCPRALTPIVTQSGRRVRACALTGIAKSLTLLGVRRARSGAPKLP